MLRHLLALHLALLLALLGTGCIEDLVDDDDSAGDDDTGDDDDVGDDDTGDDDDSAAVCTDICGDVNQDGVVNVSDIVRLNVAVGDPTLLDACGFWSADVDASGTLDSTDVDL
ncbi:MAG TPA: hypothetical protein DIU15_08815, partial [Deltaproteobacteria bacterium]|nr:hypothetical protein [Deltaproteobacteria bacterium]